MNPKLKEATDKLKEATDKFTDATAEVRKYTDAEDAAKRAAARLEDARRAVSDVPKPNTVIVSPPPPTATLPPTPPTPTPGDPSGNTPPSPTPPTAPVAPGTGLPDNMKLEITNTRTDAEPLNGKVEVELAAMGRDEKGAPVIVSAVERWIIAGKVQKDASGKPLTTGRVVLSLTKGVHKCTVEGTDRSGRPVSATADVDVNIKTKTTETPDVTVRPSK